MTTAEQVQLADLARSALQRELANYDRLQTETAELQAKLDDVERRRMRSMGEIARLRHHAARLEKARQVA